MEIRITAINQLEEYWSKNFYNLVRDRTKRYTPFGNLQIAALVVIDLETLLAIVRGITGEYEDITGFLLAPIFGDPLSGPTAYKTIYLVLAKKPAKAHWEQAMKRAGLNDGSCILLKTGDSLYAAARPQSGRRLQTGDVFYVTIQEKHHDKMKLAFDIQWSLIMVAALAGGAEALEAEHLPDFLDENGHFVGPSSFNIGIEEDVREEARSTLHSILEDDEEE